MYRHSIDNNGVRYKTLTNEFTLLDTTNLINNNLYIVSTIAVIIYIIALINYSRYLKMKIWIIILLIGLTLVPMGIWITIFYFARKNYNIQKSQKDYYSK